MRLSSVVSLFSISPLVAALIAVVAAYGVGTVWPPSAVNPDPNHIHIDVAVWVGAMKMNFNRPEWMSGTSTDASLDHEEGLEKFVHLHDNVGHVVHFHKPGLTLADFFASLGMELTRECLHIDPDHVDCNRDSMHWRMFVNGKEMPSDPTYVPADLDHILLTYDTGDMDVDQQLQEMTNDACRYSKTCPWRRAPPPESCIADPTVPCTE